ncbi:hypothetical protein BDW42DRAFT_76161 [Aspergillus taichungensis]|uniref:Uncharacterized protein n=1 Tax=Aspergillus taichungensis TaxID=482145 RepID=A0A2J5I8Z0_9EURO|nr:hypothetical protein BDW42DRAFT_76161 [Aspergillus taichungensis]
MVRFPPCVRDKNGASTAMKKNQPSFQHDARLALAAKTNHGVAPRSWASSRMKPCQPPIHHWLSFLFVVCVLCRLDWIEPFSDSLPRQEGEICVMDTNERLG